MTAVLLGTWEHDSPEWHAARADGIGASEIASVVGLSPWVSAFHLWHIKKGNLPGQRANSAMDWGHRLEPVVRDWWQERHADEWVVRPTPGTYAHEDRPWQRVNPDGLLHRVERSGTRIGTIARGNYGALYEGKTSRFGDDFGPSGSDQIPLGYRCQIQYSLDVFGLDVAHVAVLIGGNDAREYVIEADPEDQKALRDAGQAFWDSLASDTEPPIDASHDTYEAVRALNPEIDREASVEIGEMWDEFCNVWKGRESYDETLREVKSRILVAMGTARIATFNDQPVLRRQMSSAGTPYLKEIA